MRPIVWGIIGVLIGALGWVGSIVLSVVTLGTHFKLSANAFGVLMIGSLPVGVLFEILRKKNKKH